MRVTARDKSKNKKYSFLQEIATKFPGEIEIYEADLLKAGSYNEAASGCKAIIHVASPSPYALRTPRKT